MFTEGYTLQSHKPQESEKDDKSESVNHWYPNTKFSIWMRNILSLWRGVWKLRTAIKTTVQWLLDWLTWSLEKPYFAGDRKINLLSSWRWGWSELIRNGEMNKLTGFFDENWIWWKISDKKLLFKFHRWDKTREIDFSNFHNGYIVYNWSKITQINMEVLFAKIIDDKPDNWIDIWITENPSIWIKKVRESVRESAQYWLENIRELYNLAYVSVGTLSNYLQDPDTLITLDTHLKFLPSQQSQNPVFQQQVLMSIFWKTNLDQSNYNDLSESEKNELGTMFLILGERIIHWLNEIQSEYNRYGNVDSSNESWFQDSILKIIDLYIKIRELLAIESLDAVWRSTEMKYDLLELDKEILSSLSQAEIKPYTYQIELQAKLKKLIDFENGIRRWLYTSIPSLWWSLNGVALQADEIDFYRKNEKRIAIMKGRVKKE